MLRGKKSGPIHTRIHIRYAKRDPLGGLMWRRARLNMKSLIVDFRGLSLKFGFEQLGIWEPSLEDLDVLGNLDKTKRESWGV